MPLLDPSIPFTQSAALTKSLRARDHTLLSLLPTAYSLFEGTQNLYFPRRNEWLLEWLAQRLKEEDDPAGRASPRSWALLADLLQTVDDPTVVAGILKKHGVVMAVGRVLAEARARAGEEEFATPREMAMEIEEEEEDEEPVQRILKAVTQVLVTLRELARKHSAVMVATKVPVETSAALLGDFLGICEVLLGRIMAIDPSWVENILWLWRSSVWGSWNTKKICTSWSEKCLYPASTILMGSGVPTTLRSMLEDMIAEYIFSADVLQPPQTTQLKPIANELAGLLKPLRSEDTAMSGTPEVTAHLHLPVVFKIALQILQRRQHSKPNPEIVEAIYRGLLSAVANLDLSSSPSLSHSDCGNITAMLEVMNEAEIALPLPALVEIVVEAANLNRTPNSIRWDIVEQVLKNDFDVFLHPSNALLAQELFSAITISSPNEQVTRVVDLLIEGFAKARDLLGFVEHWKQGLPADIWASNNFKKAFAKRVETSLIPTQIERLVKELGEEQQWDILDAVLRGIYKPETEIWLVGKGAFAGIVDAAAKEEDACAWRVVVRIVDLEPTLVAEAIGPAEKIVEKLSTETEDVALLAAEVILRATDASGSSNVAVQQVLQLGSDGWKKGLQTFAHGLSVTVAGRFISVLEVVGSEVRNSYVDSLSVAALADTKGPAKAVWDSLVRNPVFFELPALKDAVLSALLSSLEPYPTLSQNVATVIGSKNCPAEIPQETVALVIESIMQYPLDAIKRSHRETILDTCLLLETRGGHAQVHPLIHKLWRVGNATSQLTQSVDAFLALFEVSNAEKTARRILQHTVANKDQEKMKTFLDSVLLSAEEVSKKLAKNSKQHLEFSWTVVTELWTPASGKVDDLDARLRSIRKNVLKILNHKLSNITSDNARQLQMWRDVYALERDDQGGAWEMASKVTKHLVSQSPPLSGDVETVLEGLALVFAVSESAEEVIGVSALAVVALERLPLALHPRVLLPYRSLLGRLSPSDHAISLQSVAAGCLSDKISPVAWELLKIHVDTISQPPPPIAPTSPSITTIAHFHTLLTLCLPKVTSAVAFQSILTSLDSLLRSQQWSTTQHQIDSTIASLTVLTCSSGPTITTTPELTPETLYLSILSPISAILSFHRHRIRNRYHILIPLLSQLLSLLFLPRLTRRKSERPIHPNWVVPTINDQSHLTIVSARSFARIVQTLCEPPASTVRSHHRGNREQLESEIRREKRLVAKSVAPLLEVYVKRVLEERMDGEMKKEVALAVGQVAEVLGKEGVGKVSDRMTVEARVVLRGIWKELGLRGKERV